MASSSQENIEVPLAGIWKDFVGGSDGKYFVPEPHGTKEDKDIWENQVMFPFSIADTIHAFGGPFPDHDAL
ncbi:hypothetical protein A2U01_0060255, partial [Trifolium medium]|nr:hypothetical protein [Trifolium medium]